MFSRIGRDVDAEMAATPPTIYKSPKQFVDPESTSAASEPEDWFFDLTRDGVLTRLLTDLLQARADVRKLQKDVKYGSVMYYCYEGQQLACKLIANSTYGATGVTRGRLACLVIGATVTAEGKATIMNVHDKLYERYPNGEFGTQCMGGDSVTGETPLLVRVGGRDGAVHVVRADALEALVVEHNGRGAAATSVWQPYGAEKEQLVVRQTGVPVETWSDGGFTPLVRVVRHALAPTKRVVRVRTERGLVDVTEDHSLLSETGARLRPRDCVPGATLLLHSYPEFEGVERPDGGHGTSDSDGDGDGEGSTVQASADEASSDDDDDEDDDMECLARLSASSSPARSPLASGEGTPVDGAAPPISRASQIAAFVAAESSRIVGQMSELALWSRFAATGLPMSDDEAYLWGVFMAAGEASGSGVWRVRVGQRGSAALARCALALRHAAPTLVPRLLPVPGPLGGASGEYALVPFLTDSSESRRALDVLVSMYRALFGDGADQRRVPASVLNASRSARFAFMEGCGAVQETTQRFVCTSQVGAAGLFYLMSSLGGTPIVMEASSPTRIVLGLDGDHETASALSLFGGTGLPLVSLGEVCDGVSSLSAQAQAALPLASASRARSASQTVPAAVPNVSCSVAGVGAPYVYDLETASHHFGAGVGAITAHNTDSVFFRLGHLGTVQDVGRWICEVQAYCNTLVKPPMRIEFEKAFDGSLALAPKRYTFNNVGFDAKKTYWSLFDDEDERMCVSVNEHAVAHGREPPFNLALERTRKWERLRMDPVSTLKARGMETVRRDSCAYVRTVLQRVVELVVYKKSPERAVAYARAAAQRLLDGRVPLAQLVMSKHYSKTEYATRSLPHLTIIRKCIERSLPAPELGSRIAFLVCCGARNEKAYERAEDVEYVLEHSLPVDYAYYLENQLEKPVLRILDWVFGFEVCAAPKKRYAIELAMKPLLLAEAPTLASAGADGGAPGAPKKTTMRDYFGAAPKPGRAPQPSKQQHHYVHVLHVASSASARGTTSLGALCAEAALRCPGLVYAGAVARRPGQHYFRCGAASEAPPAPAPLLALVGVTYVATRRVQRENGFEYVSVARRRVFGNLQRTSAAPAAAAPAPASGPSDSVGMHRYAHARKPCMACAAPTFSELCDACVAAAAAAAGEENGGGGGGGGNDDANVEAALERARAASAEAYERTLPVCRRCSGDYAPDSRIACANSDCEHFFPRRIAEHALERTAARCERARAELAAGPGARAAWRHLSEW